MKDYDWYLDPLDLVPAGALPESESDCSYELPYEPIDEEIIRLEQDYIDYLAHEEELDEDIEDVLPY